MGFLRSEQMELYKVTIPKDDVWKVIDALGRLEKAHFVDLNKQEQPFALTYANRIKLCDNTERRIKFLIAKCKEYKIKVERPTSVEIFSRRIEQIEQEKKRAHDLLFDAIDESVANDESFVAKQCKTIDEIKVDISKMDDYRTVLQYVQASIPQLQGAMPARVAPEDSENNEAPLLEGSLQFVAGTIRQEETERMKRMLFRATRGQALTNFQDFQQDGETKSVYLVIFSSAGRTKDKIQKICDSFLGQRFEVPPLSQLQETLRETQQRIQEANRVYSISRNQLKTYLMQQNSATNANSEDGEVSTFEIFKWFVAKEKAIYNAINMMKARHNTYIGFIWAPTSKEADIRQYLAQYPATEFMKWNYQKSAGLTPPTYFKSNELLAFHQQLTDMYNVPTYQEINPAIFSVVTFPFLFGVMYGDYGHGSIIFVAGLVICLMESKIRGNPNLEFLLYLRYFLVMAGFFAMYNGLIYNEFFAIPNEWFSSCYKVQDIPSTTGGEATTVVVPKAFAAGTDNSNNPSDYDCVYSFGFDPAWTIDSGTRLAMSNNIKEKVSIIIAYVHLNFGIVLKALNMIRAGNWKVLVFDVIAGIIIFLGLIGYFIVLIYVKWWYPVYNYADNASCSKDLDHPNICTSPNVVTVTINNVMGLIGMGDANPTNTLWFDDQQKISNILLIGTFLALPSMLCCIPCLQLCFGKKQVEDHGDEFVGVAADHGNNEEDEDRLLKVGSVDDQQDAVEGVKEFEMLLNHERSQDSHGGESMGEVFIHQMIETIEFTLGCISNTASYLRLWALSLAHGQLGEVFLMIFFQQLCPKPSTSSTGFLIPYFLVFGQGYMLAIVGVLLVMDLIEVILHTVRLHWVEFMSKFYDGNGYAYTPFSFNEVYKAEMTRKE